MNTEEQFRETIPYSSSSDGDLCVTVNAISDEEADAPYARKMAVFFRHETSRCIRTFLEDEYPADEGDKGKVDIVTSCKKAKAVIEAGGDGELTFWTRLYKAFVQSIVVEIPERLKDFPQAAGEAQKTLLVPRIRQRTITHRSAFDKKTHTETHEYYHQAFRYLRSQLESFLNNFILPAEAKKRLAEEISPQELLDRIEAEEENTANGKGLFFFQMQPKTRPSAGIYRPERIANIINLNPAAEVEVREELVRAFEDQEINKLAAMLKEENYQFAIEEIRKRLDDDKITSILGRVPFPPPEELASFLIREATENPAHKLADLIIPEKRIIGVPTKAEALLRMYKDTNHTERIPPGAFIGVAEREGLMPAIGTFVMQAAAHSILDFARQGIDVGIAYNVSPRELDPENAEEFLARTRRIAGETDAALKRINPDYKGRLSIEVTESILSDYERINKILREIRDVIGLEIAIDDFGVEYSSLKNLKSLYADCIKIDKNFVDDIVTDPTSREIARSVFTYAKDLQREVVAEGVENNRQIEELLALRKTVGVPHHLAFYAQGFHYGKPMDPTDFSKFYREHRDEGDREAFLGGFDDPYIQRAA